MNQEEEFYEIEAYADSLSSPLPMGETPPGDEYLIVAGIEQVYDLR